jgi:hypothetical protein
MRLQLIRNQACCSGLVQQVLQSPGFSRRDAATELGQSIVAATFIVVFRIRVLPHLLHEPLFEHPPDRAVERAGAQVNLALRPRGDILHDRVTMAIAISQRHKDVERGRRQRQKGLRIGLCFARDHIYRQQVYLPSL